MRTVVLFPTAGEAEAFRRRCPGVAYRITGVGPAAAAAATARAIVDERPDLLLLAGIAGVYPASEVAVGVRRRLSSDVRCSGAAHGGF